MNFYRIKNKIRTILNLHQSAFSKAFPTSYPYLSGDGFRALSDIAIDDISLISSVERVLKGCEIDSCPSLNIYIAVSAIESYENQALFFNFLNSNLDFFKGNSRLIIHNGDKIPPLSFLETISKYFYKIYCVNIINESEKIFSIPIGLENLHYVRNGLVDTFREHSCLNKLSLLKPKSNLLFSSFNVGTNLEERTIVRNQIIKSRFASTFKVVPAETYKRCLSDSFFSISPPGNGADCHRTWESIYFGVVPVVLKGYLSNKYIDNLPIHSVSSYEEFLQLNDIDLIDLYNSLISRPLDMAFLNYWDRVFREQTHER